MLAPAARGAPLAECPEIMTVAQLRDRLAAGPVTGTGYTVATKNQVEPFHVEFLGVLDDGILPGRDMIVVDATDPLVEAAGGIWAGMSGSPVYVGGKLVGAVAFSLSFGPSTIGGLTPAENMMDVLNRGTSSPTPTRAFAQRVPLPLRMRTRIARMTNHATEQVGSSLEQLPIPVSVTGLGKPKRLRALRHFFKKHDIAAIPVAGNSASGAPAAAGSLKPGSNFAAALSYGDVTYAGIGTTTMVCEGRAVAFGHPFFFTGATTMGANEASAITIVRDPLFGPYKLANVGGTVGTVDQDRIAGIRADLGAPPPTVPVHSSVTSLDSGRTNEGTTNVVWEEDVIHPALDHLFYAILVTQDSSGEGSSEMAWSIRGTTESGSSWELDRDNMYASRYGIPYETVDELHWQMHRLEDNKFEPIEFTGIDATVQVREAVRQYTISDVRVAVGDGRYRDVKRVRARPGQRIALRVVLEPFDGTARVVRELTVRVPRGARRAGSIEVTGGDACRFRCARKGVESFAGLVAVEENQPRNQELYAYLRIGRGDRADDRDKTTMGMVVTRRTTIALDIRRRRAR